MSRSNRRRDEGIMPAGRRDWRWDRHFWAFGSLSHCDLWIVGGGRLRRDGQLRGRTGKEFFVFTLSRVTTKLTNLLWPWLCKAKILGLQGSHNIMLKCPLNSCGCFRLISPSLGEHSWNFSFLGQGRDVMNYVINFLLTCSRTCSLWSSSHRR